MTETHNLSGEEVIDLCLRVLLENVDLNKISMEGLLELNLQD